MPPKAGEGTATARRQWQGRGGGEWGPSTGGHADLTSAARAG